jgi:hypothetical protein
MAAISEVWILRQEKWTYHIAISRTPILHTSTFVILTIQYSTVALESAPRFILLWYHVPLLAQGCAVAISMTAMPRALTSQRLVYPVAAFKMLICAVQNSAMPIVGVARSPEQVF